MEQLAISRLHHGLLTSETALSLRGAVVTPKDYLRDGVVKIVGNRIVEVCQWDESMGACIEVRGVISPGFIDTHNHAPYAVFQKWTPGRRMTSRFDWRGKNRCGIYLVREVDPYYKGAIHDPFKAMEGAFLTQMIQYGEMRGLLGGATTMVVDADFDPDQPVPQVPGFVRNWTSWPSRVWGVLDVSCVADKFLSRLQDDLSHDKGRLLIHLGEGWDNFSRGEFATLQLTKKLLTKNTALIHAISLLDDEWDAVAAAGATVIWSPSSNVRLYGRTVDIGAVIGRGIHVALAPDWTPTGSSTLLDEMGFVRKRYLWLDPEHLLGMVTTAPAAIMGFTDLGRIEAGCLADLLVFAAEEVPLSRSAAAKAIVDSSVDGLRMAMIAGVGVYGEPRLLEQFPAPSLTTEAIAIDTAKGRMERAVRFAAGDHPWAALVTTLKGALEAQGKRLAPLWEPTE